MSDFPNDTTAGAAFAEFRAEVKSFLHEYDRRPAAPGLSRLDRSRAFLAARYDAGLGALDYPVAEGGRGLDRRYVDVYRRETVGRTADDGGSRFGIGLDMCLPTIRDHGSAHLRRRFLGPGLRGDEHWCQLYSEPGAGSDLAGLTTRALRDGDEWVVTGQKVWTSGADHSDFGILLARTDWDVPKHAGISMLVLPMRQPGVEVRALHQMTDVAHFNEVFMDEARVPIDWVVGEPGNGWKMAVALLAHERSSIGKGGGRQPIPTDRLIELARSNRRSDDPVVRQDLARLATGTKLIEWLNLRMGIHPSITKLWRTQQGRAAADVAAGLAYPGGIAWDGSRMGATEPGRFTDPDGSHWAYGICDSPALSLGGGTDEIQKNTLGERVLGLPREPAGDRDIPFSQVPKNV
jgi:alkylation response protein AidB-like acyl-CoA dehydrogenase